MRLDPSFPHTPGETPASFVSRLARINGLASGRELCYVLLLGILASYLIPFFALAKPSVVTCTILR